MRGFIATILILGIWVVAGVLLATLSYWFADKWREKK